MNTNPEYQPIDCSLHDRLEAAATLQKPVSLTIQLPSGDKDHIEDRIRDIFTRDGAEYLKLENNTEIRLDHIESIDDA